MKIKMNWLNSFVKYASHSIVNTIMVIVETTQKLNWLKTLVNISK